MKNCLTILTIAAVIGVPATFAVLKMSFVLSHGGGLGFPTIMIAIPGLFFDPTFGVTGIIVVQIVYYILIAMAVKALFLRRFSEQPEND